MIDSKKLKPFLSKLVKHPLGAYKLRNVYEEQVGERAPDKLVDLVDFMVWHYENYPEDILVDFPKEDFSC